MKASDSCRCFDSSYTRFLVLGIISIITMMYMATYAMPSSLESVIEQTLNIPTHQFEYLFSSYTLASALSCMFGGLLTDKYFGIKKGSIIFACIAFFGQILVTVGAYEETFWFMLVGRFLLGCGSECLAVVLNCYAVVWFEEKELSFVFGFFLMVGKGFGTSLAFFIGSPLYDISAKLVKQSLVIGLSMTPYLIIMLMLILGIYLLGKLSDVCNKTVENANNIRTIDINQILKFPLIYWVFVSMLSFCTVSVMTFVPCSQKLLSEKFLLDSVEANKFCTLFNVLIALLTPIFGLIVGRTGYCLFYDVLGMVIGVSSLVALLTSNCDPYIFIILYALHFSIVNSCSWNLVVQMVDEYQLASAYGTLSVVIHVFTTISNILSGYLLEKYGTNGIGSILLCHSSIGALSAFALIMLDRINNDSLLNLSASKKEEKIKKLKESLY